MASSDLKPGDVLAEKYRVERVLGAGGMGVVVAAHHLQLDEKVALKFLLPQATHSTDAIARFVREARAAVKIKSEHVARVIDVGQLDDGLPYMVMEYLDGSDLAAWLQERGPMPVEQAVSFVLQTCEALADAHALGIVHRDLKPANLFCVQRSDGERCIKVLDFGISKLTTPGAPGNDMTRTSALLGSPLYMSPEQMKLTKGVDARTDIWSIGVILFELLSGRRPFEAEGVTDLAIKVATEPTPSLHALRGDVPPGLERLVMTCLEKDRAKRFQDVGELAIALKDFGPRNARVSVERVLGILRNAGLSSAVLPPTGAARAASPASAPAASLPQTGGAWGRTETGTKRSKRAAAGLGVAAALAALMAAGAFARQKTDASPAGGAPAATSASSPPPASGLASQAPSIAAPVPPPTSTASARAVPDAAPPSAAFPSRASPRLPRSTVSPAAPSRAKPDCNPPYVIDERGDRAYKLECMN